MKTERTCGGGGREGVGWDEENLEKMGNECLQESMITYKARDRISR